MTTAYPNEVRRTQNAALARLARCIFDYIKKYLALRGSPKMLRSRIFQTNTK
jgi:hypothetical protein